MEKAKVSRIIITIAIITALRILTMIEFFDEQHSGFGTLELHRTGFESCVTLGTLFNISPLVHKIGIELIIYRIVLMIKYHSMYTLLGIR